MHRIALRLALAAPLVIPLAGRIAFADVTDPAGAETLFRQGRASAEAGDYPRACFAFAESHRLDPTPGALLNLADCEEHTGRLASAWSHFLRVVSLLPDTDERRAVARQRADTVAPRVPWMTITLAPDAPRDARVFRDDVEMDGPRLALPLPVDPGQHSVLVVAPGREARGTTVIAIERETVRVEASAGPVVPHAPERPAHGHTAAWLVGATGIAAVGVGTYFGARALAERSMSDASCTGGVCSNPTGLIAYESARSDARASDVALGIGVVSLAVGGYLLFTSRGDAHAGTAFRVTATGVGGAW
jgi:hypothetical protein